jgi:hypothetical protein
MVTALKIPKKYFAGTGIGTGFCRVRGGRDRDEKTRSRRTLLKRIWAIRPFWPRYPIFKKYSSYTLKKGVLPNPKKVPEMSKSVERLPKSQKKDEKNLRNL